MTGSDPPSRMGRARLLTMASALVAVVVAAVVVGLLRGAGQETFSAHGVRFRYPSEWGPVPDAEFSSSENELTRDILGLDERNAVLIATYRLNEEISEDNFGEFRPEIVESIQQLVSDATGRVVSGPDDLTVDGLPGLAFHLSIPGPDGARLRSRLVVAFGGSTEYWINCRYDPAHAQEFEDGCALIVETLDVA